MSSVAPAAGSVSARPSMGTFERYLTLWVALCIVAGIGLGHLLPGLFASIASAEVARYCSLSEMICITEVSASVVVSPISRPSATS